MDTFDYLFCKARENGKVAKALSEKLQTEVDKNKIVDEIGNIDISCIITSNGKKALKYSGMEFQDITSDAEIISANTYNSQTLLASLSLPKATSIGSSAIRNNIFLQTLNMQSAISIDNSGVRDNLSLKTLDLPNATTIGEYALYNCISLEDLKLPKAEAIGGFSLFNCISLVSLNLPGVTTIGHSAMRFCISLKTLKLGINQVATLSNTNAFANTPIANGTGYIYVPDELVDSYKTATNWSVYAEQIRPMSEYVEE